MKKYSSYAMMLLMGALTIGFTSCSDDDDDNISPKATSVI